MAYYKDIVCDEDRLKCNLCSIYIENDDYLIETHINSESHRDLEVRRTLIKNSITIVNNNFVCNVCDKTLNEKELKDHLRSFIHQNILEKVQCIVDTDGIFLKLPENPNNKAHVNGAFIDCVLCDRHLPFKEDSLRSHTVSDKHRRARAIAIHPLNGIFSVEGTSDYLFCKVCRLYFENYIEQTFEHVDNKDHKTKLRKILNLIKDEKITIESFLMDPKEDKASCLKCGTGVACNVDNLERHIKGRLHSSQNKK